MIVSGLLMNVSIFIGCKRLWGFYLFVGTVLILTGFINLIDKSFCRQNLLEENDSCKTQRLVSFLSVTSLSFILIFFWIPKSIHNLSVEASRTKTKEFMLQRSSYSVISSFLINHSQNMSKKLNVIYDPMFFLPPHSDKYKITEFWGPYTAWHDMPDVIVFGSSHTKNATYEKKSPGYNDFLLERAGYSKYV